VKGVQKFSTTERKKQEKTAGVVGGATKKMEKMKTNSECFKVYLFISLRVKQYFYFPIEVHEEFAYIFWSFFFCGLRPKQFFFFYNLGSVQNPFLFPFRFN